MSTKSKSSGTEAFPGIAETQSLWQSAFKQGEEWMKVRPEAFADMQAASEEWMTHRREDFDSAVDAFKQMAQCKDFTQAAAIQQKWLSECTQRLAADWMALMGRMTKQRPQNRE